MKILQVSKLYYPWIGGVEKIVQEIAEGLNGKDNLKIEVLCCQPKGAREIKEINGVKVYQASSFGIFWGMPFSFDFFRLFKEIRNEYDIVDFHHPFPLGDLALFLFSPKGKLVVHYHSDILRQKILEIFYRPLIFSTLKKADLILVSNPNLIKSSPYLKKFSQKCKVIPFGVDLEKFENYKAKAVENLKRKYGNFVLFVGRLNYYKGVQYLIEAMKDIKANLVIIGEGREKERLKIRVERLKLGDKVFFLGPQPEDELINFYRACTVFVLPSIFRSEAFGIVLIEAMACQKPIISTELGTGTSFVNQNGVTGFVVLPKNSQALAWAIKRILGDKKLAEKFGQNSLERVRTEFSLEKMLKRVAATYQNI